MHYDVFNGDADGIIALLQLRKAEPKRSTLITGVKRDIKLLQQVAAQKDVCGVTVLDISMEKNIDALYELIERDVPVFYCDHHRTGEVPQASNFTALVNLDAQVCTSLLISQHLNHRYAQWAVAGIYGDNLFSTAEALADQIGLTSEQREFLKELGTLINYNGYGATIDDLHIPPADLLAMLMPYASPFDLKNDPESPYYLLKNGYAEDYAHIAALSPVESSEVAEVYELPCEAWARRISGVFGNALANQSPAKAHAVLTLNQNLQDYTVSVRAPLENRTGADEVCCQFDTGGGRKAAAGINQLPLDAKHKFISVLTEFYR
ncbi:MULTISPECIES: DHH family phosphoesterase [Vibrio]|uniref:Acetyltransferase n=1 Tax=Vibrio alginolyticus TaxID=663 RepID=A0A0N7EIK2_VIBAL|nr:MULTISPECIES: DHH family phosphoesterase [Vibrio]MDW2294222.1 DHH family phosphoesterase [Vibrio sp. 1404]HCG6384328.1 DHH family phosphoesterase [Vibrio parahaemolyticus]ALF35121.1 Acetyltransferase [Vibrio alginolyticus]MCA2455323.1 DHH family phosphoesterase [Vibrio alginolyticus]MCA2460557.1 DHH family phosphoesterase [Vibrio alginolyticus]